MIITNALTIEPVTPQMHCDEFRCGDDDLAAYLQVNAQRDASKNIALTFVAIDDVHTALGYYTLDAASIEFEDLPDEPECRLPHYPIQAALLSRLVVDSAARRRGLGAKLLLDAMRRIVATAKHCDIEVILAHAPDNAAIAFYLHFGFIKLGRFSNRLFLPVRTALEAVNPSTSSGRTG